MAGEANVWNPRTLIEVSANTKAVEERLTASAGQSLFILTTFVYTVGSGALEVHKNGLLLTKGVDWVEAASNSFSLTVASVLGDQIVATGHVGITGTVDVRETDIFVSNYQAIRDYVGTEVTLYSQSSVVAGDQGERFFQKLTGAAPGFWVDNSSTIIVPTGGDGSIGWVSKSTTAFKIDTDAMVADKSLAAGMVVETLRRFAARDGGGGKYDIILTVGAEDLGNLFDLDAPGLQARLIPKDANITDMTQWGVFPNWLQGDTAQQVQAQRGIDAALDGSIILFPPVHSIGPGQSSGYFFTAPLVINKYLTLTGSAVINGFRFSSLLIFEACSGLELSKDYLAISSLQIYASVTPAVVTTDPATNTWGTVGIHVGVTAACPNLTMDNVIVASFGTNFLSDSAIFHDPYYKIVSCRFFSGSINVALLGTFGGSNFIGCDIRIALQHGIYARATEGVFFDNFLLEQNGTYSIDFDSGLNPTRYGVFLEKGSATKADLHFSNGYWENMSCYTGPDTRLVIHDNDINNAVRIFGQGDIIYTGAVSPNLISADISNDWEFGGNPEVTDQTYYTRMQSDLGTAVQASVIDFSVASMVSVQDVKHIVVSFDVKVVAGFLDGSFDVDAVVRTDQALGGSDNSAQGVNWRTSNYDWTDGDWHTINYLHSPRFSPVGGLDPADPDFTFLQTSVIFSSSSFAGNVLDAHIRKPRVQFVTDKMIAGSHPFGAGVNSHRNIVKHTHLKLSALAGATETWGGAIPAGSLFLGLTGKVTKLITGATDFDVGDGVTVDLFADGIAVAATTTFTVANSGAGLTSPLYFKAATDIVVTANGGNFTAGDLVLKLYYINMIAPIF